ncbi:hypothetical protein E2C01_004917 [Portunus trituberculatus]|uniref:Uncharacterized protein n=1 Tax=Portunus trituberculatus TaxID=210409 RepID=A0A5B7CQZ1_PORTR|nr:hypothetical protein [Portunus trituberculatus]
MCSDPVEVCDRLHMQSKKLLIAMVGLQGPIHLASPIRTPKTDVPLAFCICQLVGPEEVSPLH